MVNGYRLVASFLLAHEAHLMKAKLQSEGIPCLLWDEYTVTMDWLYGNAVGGIKLLVPETCYEDALVILQTDQSAELDDHPELDFPENDWARASAEPEQTLIPETEQIRCPCCQSADISVIAVSHKESWLSTFTLGLIPPPRRRRFRCAICLTIWQET